MLAGVTFMYVPGLWYNAEQETGKTWNNHISFTNLAAWTHVLFMFSLTKASSPSPWEKPHTCPAHRLTARPMNYTELNTSAENAMEKKAQIWLGSPHGETVPWNTGEGQAMATHLNSTWPERGSSVPRVKRFSCNFENWVRGQPPEKLPRSWHMHFLYPLKVPVIGPRSLETDWGQEFRVLPPPVLHSDLNPVFFLFILYFSIIRFW